VLIEGLDSDKKEVRYMCHETLKASTGRDFGYDHLNSNETEMRLSVLRWRQWWGEYAGDTFFAQSYETKHQLKNAVAAPAGETKPATDGQTPNDTPNPQDQDPKTQGAGSQGAGTQGAGTQGNSKTDAGKTGSAGSTTGGTDSGTGGAKPSGSGSTSTDGTGTNNKTGGTSGSTTGGAGTTNGSSGSNGTNGSTGTPNSSRPNGG
jgi:hypothetical protein